MKRYKAYTKEKGIVETDNYDDICDLTRHRTDGPAVIQYYDNGLVKYEEYWVNDKCHRLGGPAIIQYNEDCNIEYESYYIKGTIYTKEQYDKKLLKIKVQSL